MTKKDTEGAYNLVFGLSIYDIFGFVTKSYRTHDSNPGQVKVSYGGVCRNIAENMARLGTNTKFISILGNDDKGKGILEHAKIMNFDMSQSLIVEDASTPTYVAILDEKGEMVSAIVDIDVEHHLTKEFIDSKVEVIKGAEYMFFGADCLEIMEYIIKTYAGQTKFVLDPVSAAKAKQVKHLLPYFYAVKPNRHEAEVLCGFALDSVEKIRAAGQYFIDLGLKEIFISLDADGIYYRTESEEGIVTPQAVEVINVTGAGDAFIAGVGYGYLNHLTVIETVKLAQVMALITISHEETIHPHMSIELVRERLNEIKWFETKF